MPKNTPEEILSRIKEHEVIAEVEAKGINQLLDKSEQTGLLYLNDAIASFRERLKSIKGAFVPAMDIEYRSFIIKLLKCIDEKHIEIVTKEIIFPTQNLKMVMSDKQHIEGVPNDKISGEVD